MKTDRHLEKNCKRIKGSEQCFNKRMSVFILSVNFTTIYMHVCWKKKKGTQTFHHVNWNQKHQQGRVCHVYGILLNILYSKASTF